MADDGANKMVAIAGGWQRVPYVNFNEFHVNYVFLQLWNKGDIKVRHSSSILFLLGFYITSICRLYLQHHFMKFAK